MTEPSDVINPSSRVAGHSFSQPGGNPNYVAQDCNFKAGGGYFFNNDLGQKKPKKTKSAYLIVQVSVTPSIEMTKPNSCPAVTGLACHVRAPPLPLHLLAVIPPKHQHSIMCKEKHCTHLAYLRQNLKSPFLPQWVHVSFHDVLAPLSEKGPQNTDVSQEAQKQRCYEHRGRWLGLSQTARRTDLHPLHVIKTMPC